MLSQTSIHNTHSPLNLKAFGKRGFVETIVFIGAIGVFVILLIICVIMLFVLKPNQIEGDTSSASFVSSSDLLYDGLQLRNGQAQQWVVLDSRKAENPISDLTKERFRQIFLLDGNFCGLTEDGTVVTGSSNANGAQSRAQLSTHSYVYVSSCTEENYAMYS
ncbi:MAG TPA: hypothetical protein VK158_01885 [Acidobacteriota bacterium]|nr:hypothetical protein [Acidobacteriota bacterium]